MTRSTSNLSPQILEEATDWFVEFSEGTVDAAARGRFDAWLRRSPEHVQAYLKVAALWEDASLLAKGRSGGAHELIARVLAHDNVVPLVPRSAPADVPAVPLASDTPNWPPVQDTSSTTAGEASAADHLPTQTLAAAGAVSPKTSDPRTKSRWPVIAVAASLLTVTVVGGWLYSQRGTYSTGTGEQRSVRLEDGSIMELNSRSRARVRYAKHERTVEMLEGQAFFQVAKDAARPFIVRSDSTSVRAVGTQFDVYRRESGTTVTVLEGRVAVFSAAPTSGHGTSGNADSPVATGGSAEIDSAQHSTAHRQPGRAAALPSGRQRSTSPPPSRPELGTATLAPDAGQEGVFLAAGEQLTVAPEHAPAQPHHADPVAATAWTQHKIILQRTPLSEVAVEFNRYNTRQLVITDPSLANTQITGVFSSTDPDSLLRFLRTLPGVDVQEDPAEIRIARR